MAQQQQPAPDDDFTDDELRELRASGEDLSFLTPAEQARLENLADFKSGVVGERGDDWTDYLPTAGATAVGMLGGGKTNLVGATLAGMGGAAGEASKQIIDVLRGNMDEVPEPGVQQLKKIITEGLVQGGYDWLGGKAMQLAKRPMRGLYEYALKPGLADARNIGGKDILEGGEELAEAGIENWILPASKRGSRRAGRLATKSKLNARQMARQSGEKVDVSDFASQVEKDQMDKVATRMADSGAATNTAPMREQVANLVANQPVQVPRPHTITPSRLSAITKYNQKQSAPAFRAAKGQFYVPPPELGSGLSVSKSIADVGKRNLDNMLGEAFTAANKNTSTLTGLKDVVAAGARRSGQGSNIAAGLMGSAAGFGSGNIKNAAIATILTKILTNPNVQGGAAIAGAKFPYGTLFSGLDAAGVTPDVRALFGQDEEE